MEDTKDFIMKPKVDVCFKELMEDALIRKGFIAALLNIPPEDIRETVLLPTHTRKQYEDEKLGILDVKVLLNDETHIDLEIQIALFPYWTERSLFYLCKTFTDQIHEGDGYEVLGKAIQVGILNFILYPEDEVFYSRFHFREDERMFKYSDKLEIHVLELPKLDQHEYPESALLDWARFLHAEKKEEMQMLAEKNEYLDKAYHTVVRMSADEEKRLEYEAREKAIRDYNHLMKHALFGDEKSFRRGRDEGFRHGSEEGFKRGSEKTLITFICKKLRKSKTPEQIAEELEEDLPRIQYICKKLKACAPDYDEEKAWTLWEGRE